MKRLLIVMAVFIGIGVLAPIGVSANNGADNLRDVVENVLIDLGLVNDRIDELERELEDANKRNQELEDRLEEIIEEEEEVIVVDPDILTGDDVMKVIADHFGNELPRQVMTRLEVINGGIYITYTRENYNHSWNQLHKLLNVLEAEYPNTVISIYYHNERYTNTYTLVSEYTLKKIVENFEAIGANVYSVNYEERYPLRIKMNGISAGDKRMKSVITYGLNINGVANNVSFNIKN